MSCTFSLPKQTTGNLKCNIERVARLETVVNKTSFISFPGATFTFNASSILTYHFGCNLQLPLGVSCWKKNSHRTGARSKPSDRSNCHLLPLLVILMHFYWRELKNRCFQLRRSCRTESSKSTQTTKVWLRFQPTNRARMCMPQRRRKWRVGSKLPLFSLCWRQKPQS